MNPVFRWVANGTTTSEWSHETLGAEVPRLSGAPVGIKWRPFGVSTGYRSDLFWALSFSADSGRLTASQLIGKPYFETTCTVLFFQRWAYGYSALSVFSCGVHPVSVTRFPSFRTQPLENLSHYLRKKGFLSNPDPGENLLSGNLVMETGCID